MSLPPHYETTDWFQIGKGLRQGCILSPCLFNLYAEYIMRNVRLEETQAGIKIAGRNINHLRYVDPRADGLILRCVGKAGNPFQTTQGNRLSCRDQEGRRGSEEAVPGPSVFPSGLTGDAGLEKTLGASS